MYENVSHVLEIGMDIKSLRKSLCEVEVRFNGELRGLMKGIARFQAQLEEAANLASE